MPSDAKVEDLQDVIAADATRGLRFTFEAPDGLGSEMLWACSTLIAMRRLMKVFSPRRHDAHAAFADQANDASTCLR